MNDKTKINITKHFLKKQYSRRIKKEDISLCLKYGRKIYRAGACFYTILNRDIKKLNLPERLSGLCVLVAEKNTLITVYKNQNAISNTKKLTKFNFKKNCLIGGN